VGGGSSQESEEGAGGWGGGARGRGRTVRSASWIVIPGMESPAEPGPVEGWFHGSQCAADPAWRGGGRTWMSHQASPTDPPSPPFIPLHRIPEPCLPLLVEVVLRDGVGSSQRQKGAFTFR